MRIAVEGCCHGELDNIYSALQEIEARSGQKIDLLLICGDFQACRNEEDLNTMACPPKYRNMNTFYKYYSGEKVAPLPTIFIGGNHEACSHLWELPYGGWVAPNIYYLGFAGVVTFGGVRIAGWTGIYEDRDFSKGHFEVPPFNDSSMRSFYHTRAFEFLQLRHLTGSIDVFLSHDWPLNIASHGDMDTLLRKKPFLREDIERRVLGSPPAERLLEHLKPAYWFSAHMHCKFPAVVVHGDGTHTRFLALDKCLPRRDFLQVLDLPTKGPLVLSHDAEWLAILRATASLRPTVAHFAPLPAAPVPVTSDAIDAVRALLPLTIPAETFVRVVPSYIPGGRPTSRRAGPIANPQTQRLCTLLAIPDPCAPALAGSSSAPHMAGHPVDERLAPLPRAGPASTDHVAIAAQPPGLGAQAGEGIGEHGIVHAGHDSDEDAEPERTVTIVRRNANLYAAAAEGDSQDQPAAGSLTHDEFSSSESDRQRLRALLNELRTIGERVMGKACGPDTRLAELLELCEL